jgi:hypothetical protein
VLLYQNRVARLPEIIEAARDVLSHVNQDDLLRYYGIKTDTRSGAATIKRLVCLPLSSHWTHCVVYCFIFSESFKLCFHTAVSVVAVKWTNSEE